MQEKVDKQQGPTVQHRELFNILWETIMENNMGKNVCVCIYVYIYIYMWNWVTWLYSSS